MNKLTLPLPISENAAWRSVAGLKKGFKEVYLGYLNGKRTWAEVKNQLFCNVPLSKPYRAWKKLCELPLAAQETDVLEGEVSVTATFFFDSRRGDMPNRPKVLLDILQGVCYKNDAQVYETHFYRVNQPGNPRVEVEVVALEPELFTTEELAHTEDLEF